MDHGSLTPEQLARKAIDAKLIAAGWAIQDKKKLNLYENLGVAVREMDTDTGPADYMLFIDAKACGIIEAKKEGADLGGVAEQSQRYATSGLKYIQRDAANDQPLPFVYEATNQEIRFRDERDPHPRSRYVFHFHQPETLKDWLEEGSSLRRRLQDLPELHIENLRACQIDAIKGIEHSLKQARPRALLQMATGSGKTYTAITQVHRLSKFAKIKRALFLVDRGNLATNAKDEFEQFVIPHDGRKFTQHYNVNILGRTGIPDANKVTISTIQRLYSQLTGQELDDEADEHSGFEVEGSLSACDARAGTINREPRPVSYNPNIPIEEFDVIIIDECHRSIYNLWRQVLEYFDAFLIGLTNKLEQFKAKGKMPKDDKWKKKYKEAPLPDTEELPLVPENWKWVNLQHVFDVITDGDHQAPPKSEDGIPFLVIGNVNKGILDFSNTRFVPESYFNALSEMRIPRKGNILYTVVGSYGIPVIVDTDREFCVQRHVAILKPSKEISVDYLYHILSSGFVFKQATDASTGTAQKTVPLGGLREMKLPLPSFSDQKEMASLIDEKLSSMNRLYNELDDKVLKAEKNKQSILTSAFSGVLHVIQ